MITVAELWQDWQGLRGFEAPILLAILAGVMLALFAHWELGEYRHDIDRVSGLPSIDSITRRKRVAMVREFGAIAAVLFLLAFLAFAGRP